MSLSGPTTKDKAFFQSATGTMAASHNKPASTEIKSHHDTLDPIANAFLKNVDVPLVKRFKDFLTADFKNPKELDQASNTLLRYGLYYNCKNADNNKNKITAPGGDAELSPFIKQLETEISKPSSADSHNRHCFILGLAYFFGIGVAINRDKVEFWLNKSNDFGPAYHLLGWNFAKNNHHIENSKEKMDQSYYVLAALLGSSQAMYKLANGFKTNKNLKKVYFDQALSLENEDALMDLAERYQYGSEELQLPVDLAKRKELLEKLALKGNDKVLRKLVTDKNGRWLCEGKTAFYLRISDLAAKEFDLLSFMLHFDGKLAKNPIPEISYHTAIGIQDYEHLANVFMLDPAAILKLFQSDLLYQSPSLTKQTFAAFSTFIMDAKYDKYPEAHQIRNQIALSILEKVNPKLLLKNESPGLETTMKY